MFKFLHAADVHLDSPLNKLDYYEGAPVEEFRQATRRAFENLVKTAILKNVGFVLIAGDLYDGDWKDYNTGLYFVSQMIKMGEAGIDVFIVSGNHDAASRITKTLRLPENVRLFPSDRPATFFIEKLNVAVHGQSFSSPAVKKDLSRHYPAALEGYYNIGILHTCLSGREGHEPYAPCSLKELNNKGYDYWALGHVHQYEMVQTDPPVVFSGNIQGRHIRETGTKGCVMASVDDTGRTNLEFQPLDVVRWAIAEVDAGDAKSGYDIVDRAVKHLEDLLAENNGMSLAVRIHIKGETFAHNEIFADIERWTNEIRSATLEAGGGRIWVEKVKFKTDIPANDRYVEGSDGAVGELLKVFDELKTNPDACRNLVAELDGLEKKLPRELKKGPDGIRLNDPGWLSNLLKQAEPMLVRRLLKKEGTQ